MSQAPIPKRPLSNFCFLKPAWPGLASEAAKAERNVLADPRAACFYARRVLELAVTWLYDADRALARPYREDLSSMLFEPSFQAAIDARIRTKMDVIRKQGNAAVHRQKRITASEAAVVVRELFHVMFWLARTYARAPEDAPHPNLAFDLAAIPRPITPEQRQATLAALRRKAEEQAARDAELERARAENEGLQAELERLRAEVAAAKAVNAARPDDHDYDEDTTRDLYIDLLLREAGWPLDESHDREFEVTGMPNATGVGYIDYVLWGNDGKPLAVVEAKRTRRDANVGRQQAKLYADCLERRFGQRPVIFYSNGYETWLWDDASYPPRAVQGFYTKDELALLINRRTSRRRLASLQISSAIVARHYQQRAIRRIAATFEEDNQRKALVVMATGAGKTRTVVALIDLLMRAGWIKRVLFLADRVALVNQAVGTFKAHLPDATTVNLVTERSADGRVYASTYPTMMGLIGEAQAGETKRFGPGFFDLVVIDEAHRSVYQKYRAIFAYFDSLLVGLTATPKDDVDHNTYELFGLEPGVPTDAYGLEEAVAEGYLVPPRAVMVPLKFPREGVRYDDLSEDEKEAWEAQDWGDDEQPDTVAAEAVNRWLFNSDTVDKVLETLITRGHRVAGGDRLGKTIVFAKNNEHAEFIARRFDANFPEHAGHFARVITYRTEYAQSLIDDFSQKDKAPHIAMSVDMLDTGIDVPEVVNLVFFKPVRSKTKFWQMIGRGTRLCRDLYGPGEHKQDFFVFDCCENIAFFNQDIPAVAGAGGESLRKRLFSERLELILALADADGDGGGTTSEAGLRADTIALLRSAVEGMNVNNFLVRPHRRLVERYREKAPWEPLEPDGAAELAAGVGDLPTAVRDDDEEAKRFDLIVLKLQLGRLRGEPGQERLRRQVQEIAASLLEQLSIPAIREQQELLADLAGDEWWVDVTVPMLERARRRVRGLVRLLEKRKRVVVYTDFVDELGEVEEIELRGVTTGTDFERFREKARAYLRRHDAHVALQKLRRNKPLTATDIQELEGILADAAIGTSADIDRAREGDGLGVFVRSLVGLDRDAATDALSAFVNGRVLSAHQYDFVALVVEHLTANGIMEPELLYEPPFTDVAIGGPEGLFADAEVSVLIAAIEGIRANARPHDEAA
ncbi:MAG: type restriction enzyme subunit [Gaiellaceae bacterium]|nr:type restriction enzyme subunit [Gaiellaceae bacterium]